MRVSHATLRRLAAGVWYTGGFVLLLTGTGYVVDAMAMRSGSPVPLLAAAAAIALGALRGRATFARGCRKNLDRIDALPRPRAWQFFRARFFLALAAMIAGGALLRRIAEAGGFAAGVAVGALELTIAVALLTSSREFWRRGPEKAERGEAGRTVRMGTTPGADGGRAGGSW